MKHNIDRLLDIMQQLRDPQKGCPWDLAQTFTSILPHTIEETYELVEAIECAEQGGDRDAVKDELGDLLFQIVFYAQLAREQGWFEFEDIASAICDKLIRRHPHVFADARVKDAAEQTVHWEQLKAREKTAKSGSSVLDDVTTTLPALTLAYKLQKRAARVGFDWPDRDGVLQKLEEELAELKAANSRDAQLDELGDVLFTCVNLARHLGSDPESVMRRANTKFSDRFRKMEALLQQQGKRLDQGLSLDDMETAWQKAKNV